MGPYGVLQAVPKVKLLRITDQVSKLIEMLPLIDELDASSKPQEVAPTVTPPTLRRTYSLQHLAPERAITLIKAILGVNGAMEPGPDGKSLIAVLTEEQHHSLKEFLAEIDLATSESDKPSERTFTLHHAASVGVAEMLTSLFPPMDSSVNIAAEPASNVVAVKGPGRIVDQIARLIESLDEQAKANAPVQRLYRTPGDAQGILTQLRAAFTAKDQANVGMTLDPSGQAILVSASPAIQDRIKESIENWVAQAKAMSGNRRRSSSSNTRRQKNCLPR